MATGFFRHLPRCLALLSQQQITTGLPVQDDILLEDKAADILSCGAVLYTMLTKCLPGQAQPASSAGHSAGHSIADPLDVAQEGPLHSLQWPPNCAISPACKDLLQLMLCSDSAARPTVHEILEHPWYMQDLPREIQVQPQSLPCAG